MFKAAWSLLFVILFVTAPAFAGVNDDLLAAAKAGNMAKLQTAIARGADVDTQDAKGETALHLAAVAGRLDIISLLVARGASVNLADRVGITPLHVAAFLGKRDIAALLLRLGADPNAKDAEGKTPLDHAADNPSLNAQQKVQIELLLQPKAPSQAQVPPQSQDTSFACADVGRIAERIKPSNPGVDPATLHAAIVKAQELMGCQAPLSRPAFPQTTERATTTITAPPPPAFSAPPSTTCLPVGNGGTRCTTVTPGQYSVYTTCMPSGDDSPQCTTQ